MINASTCATAPVAATGDAGVAGAGVRFHSTNLSSSVHIISE